MKSHKVNLTPTYHMTVVPHLTISLLIDWTIDWTHYVLVASTAFLTFFLHYLIALLCAIHVSKMSN